MACHNEKRIIEIKCPYSIRTTDPKKVTEQGLLKYLTKCDGQFRLVPGETSRYYEQVKGCMAVVRLKHCDFMVWTKEGALVVPIELDEQFWLYTLLPNLIHFFNKFVVPVIITERNKNGLSLFDEYDSAQDDNGTCEISIILSYGNIVEHDSCGDNTTPRGDHHQNCNGKAGVIEDRVSHLKHFDTSSSQIMNDEKHFFL